jgi:hypothetical protein
MENRIRAFTGSRGVAGLSSLPDWNQKRAVDCVMHASASKFENVLISPEYTKHHGIFLLKSDQFFFNCHFFDFFIQVGAVLHAVPLLITHSHKKIAGGAFNPGFIMIRKFSMNGCFSALGTGQFYLKD